jgi:hypothetical protein
LKGLRIYMNDTDATVFLEQLKNGTYGSPNQ